MPDTTIPTHKYSLGRRVVFKEKGGTPKWGTVECFSWSEEHGGYVYVVAAANGDVIKLAEPQLTGFDRLK